MKQLLVNKGYTLIHEGNFGTDLYIAIDPHTGAICLIVANEGSQYFKEIVLADAQIEIMFEVATGEALIGYGYVPSKTGLGKHLLKEDFKNVSSFEKEVGKGIIKTNEAFVRNIAEEEMLSLARVAHINNTLVDICIVNLTYAEVSVICGYLAELAQKANEEAAKIEAEKKEEEK